AALAFFVLPNRKSPDGGRACAALWTGALLARLAPRARLSKAEENHRREVRVLAHRARGYPQPSASTGRHARARRAHSGSSAMLDERVLDPAPATAANTRSCHG